MPAHHGAQTHPGRQICVCRLRSQLELLQSPTSRDPTPSRWKVRDPRTHRQEFVNIPLPSEPAKSQYAVLRVDSKVIGSSSCSLPSASLTAAFGLAAVSCQFGTAVPVANRGDGFKGMKIFYGDDSIPSGWPPELASLELALDSRSVSEYSSVLPHCPLVFAGLLPFGFGPALGAHYPPSTRSGAVGAAPNLQKIVCQADQLPLG